MLRFKAKSLKKQLRLRDTEQKIREELEDTKNEWKEKQGQTDTEVTPDDIASVVSSWTGIPVSKACTRRNRYAC